MSNKKYDSLPINISLFPTNCSATKLNNSHHFITSSLLYVGRYNNREEVKRSLRWCLLFFVENSKKFVALKHSGSLKNN
jgi:hypothetical protein